MKYPGSLLFVLFELLCIYIKRRFYRRRVITWERGGERRNATEPSSYSILGIRPLRLAGRGNSFPLAQFYRDLFYFGVWISIRSRFVALFQCVLLVRVLFAHCWRFQVNGELGFWFRFLLYLVRSNVGYWFPLFFLHGIHCRSSLASWFWRTGSLFSLYFLIARKTLVPCHFSQSLGFRFLLCITILIWLTLNLNLF